MSTPYSFWLEQARRWDKCVDFGSPLSAWDAVLWAVYDELLTPVPPGERDAALYQRAMTEVRRRRAEVH